MRYVRTACGHRIFADSGGEVRQRVHGATVSSVLHDKGFVLLAVPAAAAAALTHTDREIRRRLLLPRGPWNAEARVLTVKVGRGCRIGTGGEWVGRLSDCLPGRPADAELQLAGAWATGYMWRATSLALGPCPTLAP